MLERRMHSDIGLMSLWRRFQQGAKPARALAVAKPLRALYLDEVYLRIRGRAQWGLLALGEAADGTRHYLGASLTPERSQQAWQELLDSLGIAAWGKGVVVHDGDQAIAQAVAMVMPKARERRCLWHQLQNLIGQAREQFPQESARRHEAIQRGKQALLEAALSERPRTTSPLERGIKELRGVSGLWTALVPKREPLLSSEPGWSKRTLEARGKTGWSPLWHNT
jgi:hypothetical protein